MNNKKDSSMVCLLATGSAYENVKGISHLFEHIFVTKCLSTFNIIINAHTTEDYVMLFWQGIPPQKIIDTLRHMTFEKEELEFHKKVVIREIEKESSKEREAFFRFVWQDTGTGYEKSPLGTIKDITTITTDMLEELRAEILKKPLFFYSDSAGLETYNTIDTLLSPLPVSSPDITWRKSETYRLNGKDRCYDICYFNHQIEAFYLLERILHVLNPDKHIQLSEKKQMSALIIEAGAQFPGPGNISALREQSLNQLDRDLSEIKANFKERALNELESFYFYGKMWQERIAQLFQATDRQLLSMVEQR